MMTIRTSENASWSVQLFRVEVNPKNMSKSARLFVIEGTFNRQGESLVYRHIHTDMFVCTHIFMYVCIYVCIYRCIHVDIHTFVFRYIYIYTRTYVCIYMYVYGRVGGFS